MDDRISSSSRTATADDSIDYAALLAYLEENPRQLQEYVEDYFQKNPHLAYLLKGPDQVKLMQRLARMLSQLEKNAVQIEKNNEEFDTKFEAMGRPYRG
jgi:hypothetical protein